MFSFQEADGFPILLALGDVDVLNVHDFDLALRRLEDLSKPAGVISLEYATFVSVHAFGVVTSCIARAARRGRRLIVVCPDGSFHLKILRLLRFPYEIAHSVGQATSALRRREGAAAQS